MKIYLKSGAISAIMRSLLYYGVAYNAKSSLTALVGVPAPHYGEKKASGVEARCSRKK
jgi:hypothetical protein